MKTEPTLDDVQELFEMLTGGSLPDGMHLREQPKLSAKAAYGVIYFLQEHLRLLPDTIELCAECEQVYESDDGWSVSEDGWDDHAETYTVKGVTPELMKEYEGTFLCSPHCEDKFWPRIIRERRETANEK